MSNTRSMTREIGTALAVLAIYLLTVLAPLHQARASQLALEDLGYTTLAGGWVLCTTDGIKGQDTDASVAKCPATGIGKQDLAVPTTGVLLHEPAELAAAERPMRALPAPAAVTPPTGLRGPPALV